jgi:hypothetical protein
MVYAVKYCDYCHSSVVTGQRWVREKISNPRPDSWGPTYRHYHAEPFAGEEGSCWEKHQMEKEFAQTAP